MRGCRKRKDGGLETNSEAYQHSESDRGRRASKGER